MFKPYKILTIAIISAGILISFIQFIFNRSLWLDEALLALNILNRNHLSLLGHLGGGQVAPIFFLQIEKTITEIGGNSEYALRLFPLVSFLLSIFFFYKILHFFSQNPLTIIFALSMFIFNTTIIYYASEVKQYMTDVLVLLTTYYIILKNYDNLNYKYLILASWGALAIFLSNVAPVILTTAGIYLIYSSIKSTKLEAHILLQIFEIWFVTFAVYYVLFIHNHPSQDYMLAFWEKNNAFLPMNPLHKEFYVFIYKKASLLTYILFNKNIPGTIVYSLIILYGVILTIKKSKIYIIILSILPLLIHLTLSGFRLYPFDIRLILYLFPTLIIIAVQGIEKLIEIGAPKIGSRKVALFVLVLPITMVVLLLRNFPIQKDEIKSSLTVLKTHKKQNEKLFINYYGHASFQYYQKIKFYPDTASPVILGSWNNGITEQNLHQIKQLQGSNWVLLSHPLNNEEDIFRTMLNVEKIQILKEIKDSQTSLYLINKP